MGSNALWQVEENRTRPSAEFGVRIAELGNSAFRIHHSALECGAVAQLVER